MTAARALLFLTQLVLVEHRAWTWLLPNETDCPSEALVDVTNAVFNSSATVDGVYYPRDTIEYVQDKSQNTVDNVYFSENKQSTDAYRIMGCPCRTRVCLSLCCAKGNCTQPIDRNSGHNFFPIYDPKTNLVDVNASVVDFWQIPWDPCHGTPRYSLDPKTDPNDTFQLFSNGILHYYGYNKNYTKFCVEKKKGQWKVMMCFEDPEAVLELPDNSKEIIKGFCMLISVPFLLVTFLAYLLIEELMNLHGQTLCTYILCLIVGYSTLGTLLILRQDSFSDLICFFFAYIVHFSFLASFFWLNVMCFDIWWTFGGFRSLHGSVKQRERKKFIMYSIYAWGCASIITITCIIMDQVPGIPETFIRPEFGKGSCWFFSDKARFLYFYLPMAITIICNICLFVLTALKLVKHKKDTARQLKGSDSRRHDDNKQWFNLYLKLFIVMGINWSTEIISWLFEEKLKWLWYITDLTNTLQGVIIFVIFVWKDKIKRLLLKRFGCDGGNFLSRNSNSRTGCANANSVSTRTCVTTAPLHEKSNPYSWKDSKGKSNMTFDESDGV